MDNGRRIKDWEGYAGPPGSFPEGRSLTQTVYGQPAWNFGPVQSPPANHFPRQSHARAEEIFLESPQNYAPKREYHAPRQQVRAQHGPPIMIYSGGSPVNAETHVQPLRAALKRIGSPSMMHMGSVKRQHTYTSPGMMQSSRPISDNRSQRFFAEQPQQYEIRYISGHQAHQQEALQLSHSSHEQGPQIRVVNGQHVQAHFEEPPQYTPPHREVKVLPYHLSPEGQFRTRQLTHHIQQSSPQRWPEQHPLQEVVTHKQDRHPCRAQSQHRQFDSSGMAQMNDFHQLGRGALPEKENLAREQSEQSPLKNASPQSSAPEKHQPQLGSPLWANKKARIDVPEPPTQIRVAGRNVVKAGSNPIPWNQIDPGNGPQLPFTPPHQRGKTPGRSHRLASATQRGRSKSVAPSSVVREVSQSASRAKTPYQPPSVEDAPDDASESTPLNEVLRRQQHGGQLARKNLEEIIYKASNVLPPDSIFGNDRPKTTKTKSAVPQNPLPGRPQLSTEVISLLTPEAGSTAGRAPVELSPSPPAIRSIPMKERIAPAKKPTAKKSAATPKAASRQDKATPKANKVPKKQKEVPMDPAVALQQRAADLIVNKEIQGADEARDLEIFGDIVGMTEEEKAKQEEEMRAEAQRQLIAKAAEIQAKEEAEQLAAMEKMKVQAEKEEKERLNKEIEDDRAKARRDAERKKQERLEELERDKLRDKAMAKIAADRKKDAEEAEERERLKKEAKEKAEKVQAEAEELAKLKAKQEEAKKQAASLTASKIFVPDGRKNVDTGDADKDGDVAMEDDSLFLPEIEPEATEYV